MTYYKLTNISGGLLVCDLRTNGKTLRLQHKQSAIVPESEITYHLWNLIVNYLILCEESFSDGEEYIPDSGGSSSGGNNNNDSNYGEDIEIMVGGAVRYDVKQVLKLFERIQARDNIMAQKTLIDYVPQTILSTASGLEGTYYIPVGHYDSYSSFLIKVSDKTYTIEELEGLTVSKYNGVFALLDSFKILKEDAVPIAEKGSVSFRNTLYLITKEDIGVKIKGVSVTSSGTYLLYDKYTSENVYYEVVIPEVLKHYEGVTKTLDENSDDRSIPTAKAVVDYINSFNFSVEGGDGKSAYDIAVENGFEGTVEDWLESLIGRPFRYEDFTEEQLKDLKGEPFTFEDLTEEQIELLRGYTPQRGVDYWTVEDITTIQTYVSELVSNIVGSAPTTLDTLSKLAKALGNDPNFSTTITDTINQKFNGLAKVASSGNYYDLEGTPTNVSSFENDKGYLTSETDPTVPDWAKESKKPAYTYDEVGAEEKGTALGLLTFHNTDTEGHSDIRLLIKELSDRLNAVADSTDIDLNQLSEVVTYIKENRDLIEGVTSSKVNVADIIPNLTTNVDDKPLSASQGVLLKALIDAITVPTKVSQLVNDENYLKQKDLTDYITKEEVLELFKEYLGGFKIRVSNDGGLDGYITVKG